MTDISAADVSVSEIELHVGRHVARSHRTKARRVEVAVVLPGHTDMPKSQPVHAVDARIHRED